MTKAEKGAWLESVEYLYAICLEKMAKQLELDLQNEEFKQSFENHLND